MPLLIAWRLLYFPHHTFFKGNVVYLQNKSSLPDFSKRTEVNFTLLSFIRNLQSFKAFVLKHIAQVPTRFLLHFKQAVD